MDFRGAENSVMTERIETRVSPPLLENVSFRLNFRAISLLEGLRAAAAVALTMAVAGFLDLPQLNIAALGALLTCFADPGGPLASRLPPMWIFGLLGGTAFGVFPLALSGAPTGAVLLASTMIFAASLARIYGQGGMQAGNLISVAIVLALDAPVAVPLVGVKLGLSFAAGAAWASVLTLVLWRFRPYAPARAALAQIARSLADMVRSLDVIAGQRVHDRETTRHRMVVREAIENAREITLATFRRRGAASERANQITLRLAALDTVFEVVIALSASLDEAGCATPYMHRALEQIRQFLTSIAGDLENDRSLVTPERSQMLARLRESAAAEADPRVAHLISTVIDRLLLLLNVTSPVGEDFPALAQRPPRWHARLTGPLRSNLTWRSIPFRHAVRTALVIFPVLMLVQYLHNPFGHWLAITVILTLQPHFSATWARAAERVAGTTLGGALAAVIGLVCVTPGEIALAMIPLTLLAFAIKGVNYSLYIAILTPMIVLLIEQVMPGSSQLVVAMSRIGFTVAGGVLAVGANLLLWPSFESNRLDAAVRQAVDAHRDYLRAVLGTLATGSGSTLLERRMAGLASNNLEASVNRTLAEPHRSTDEDLQRAIVMGALLRRAAGRLANLAIMGRTLDTDARGVLPAWSERLLAAMDSGRPSQSWPPAPPMIADSLTRLARQSVLIGSAAGARATTVKDTRS